MPAAPHPAALLMLAAPRPAAFAGNIKAYALIVVCARVLPTFRACGCVMGATGLQCGGAAACHQPECCTQRSKRDGLLPPLLWRLMDNPATVSVS